MLNFRWAVGLVLVAALGGCASGGGNPASVTVEMIMASPESYHDKQLQVRACAVTDVHQSWLISCESSDVPMISFIRPVQPDPRTAAVLQEYFGFNAAFGPRRSISGVFSGKFEWVAGARPAARLHITRISEFHVSEL
jgi:hypothetical protein